jgi:hypothetical protein
MEAYGGLWPALSPSRGERPVTNGLPPELDAGVPNSARIWNYWLGGKDNYPVDREAGEQFRAVFPEIVEVARSSRAFLGRAVRWLAGEAGVRQFLDIGTGIPSAGNVHEVAQEIAPEARVLYVDNDPVVLAHARALLTGSQGATAYVDADLHDPQRILELSARSLDLDRPVAVMLLGVLGHIGDDDEARSILRRLLDGVASGSYLVLCDGTNTSQTGIQAQQDYDESGAVPYRLRSPEQIAAFFEGLELVELGVVSCPRWRPDGDGQPAETDAYGGVGRKP